MKKKLISSIISLIVAGTVVIPTIALATGPRDPNGNGYISSADGSYINYFLSGSLIPTNLTPLDFDQNGIISAMDSYKVNMYDAGITNIVPDANVNDPVISANTSELTYTRHNCFSNSNYEYTLYPCSLTPNNVNNDYPDSIIGNNDLVYDSNKAVVRITNQGGTGFIVDNHVIATAAHCVYNDNNDTFYDFDVEIVGDNGQLITSYSPHYIHIPNMYRYNDDSSYDYALIYVDSDLSQHGMFKLGYSFDSYQVNEEDVNVAGFPVSYPPNLGIDNQDWGIRFHSQGNLIDPSGCNVDLSLRLVYNADTEPGMSGGPVYVTETVYLPQYNVNVKYNIAIGIHTWGNYTFGSINPVEGNSGIRINCQHLKFYYNNSNITA